MLGETPNIARETRALHGILWLFSLCLPQRMNTEFRMSRKPAKRLTLLEAYEDLTRKESVCLREDRFEDLNRVQRKKAQLLEGLDALRVEPLDADEQAEFDKRIASLQERESSNAALLTEKMTANRSEFRKLRKHSASASKLKRAYAAPEQSEQDSGSLKGRA